MVLYALSILARYMPSAWQRIEGGDEDHYLALVKAALAVWERVLPEQFLESITGERFIPRSPGVSLPEITVVRAFRGHPCFLAWVGWVTAVVL